MYSVYVRISTEGNISDTRIFTRNFTKELISGRATEIILPVTAEYLPDRRFQSIRSGEVRLLEH